MALKTQIERGNIQALDRREVCRGAEFLLVKIWLSTFKTELRSLSVVFRSISKGNTDLVFLWSAVSCCHQRPSMWTRTRSESWPCAEDLKSSSSSFWRSSGLHHEWNYPEYARTLDSCSQTAESVAQHIWIVAGCRQIQRQIETHAVSIMRTFSMFMYFLVIFSSTPGVIVPLYEIPVSDS